MKTVDNIKEEYKEYQTQSTFVNTLEDFIAFLDIGIGDTDDDIRNYATLLHQNKKWCVEAFVRNLFPMFFEEKNIEFYDYDNELLEQGIQLSYTQKAYYQALKEIAKENNYKELLRLMDFSFDYYNIHKDYIETAREIVELRFQGISMSNSRYQDNRRPFHEFFMGKISELAPHKIVEKTIKM